MNLSKSAAARGIGAAVAAFLIATVGLLQLPDEAQAQAGPRQGPPADPDTKFVYNTNESAGTFNPAARRAATIGNEPNSYTNPTAVQTADKHVAASFTTGSGLGGFKIKKLQVVLHRYNSTPAPSLTIHPHNSVANAPADDVLATFTTTDTLGTNSRTGALATFLTDSPPILNGNTRYWVKLSDRVSDSTTVQFYVANYTLSDSQSGESGWSIGDEFKTRIGTGAWETMRQHSPQIQFAIYGERMPTPHVLVDSNPYTDQFETNTYLEFNEGGAFNFRAKLASAPAADVTVQIPSFMGNPEFTFTFTTSNWNEPQTQSLTAVDDNIALNVYGSITAAITGGFSSTEIIRYKMVNLDTGGGLAAIGLSFLNDVAKINEGDTLSVGVELDYVPNSTVVATMTSNLSEGLRFTPATITFRAGEIHKIVSVTALQDDNWTSEKHTITVSAEQSATQLDGTPDFNVTVGDTFGLTVIDDEPSGFVYTPTSITLVEDSNATASYTLKLAAAPTEDVTVAVKVSPSLDDLLELVTPQTDLTFTSTNWNVGQTVTVRATGTDLDGADSSGNFADGIEHTASGGLVGVHAQSVTVTDIHEQGVVLSSPFVRLPASAFFDWDLRVTEGANVTFTVRLATKPILVQDSQVLVRFEEDQQGSKFTSNDAWREAVTTPADRLTLRFDNMNWNVDQTVTMHVPEEAVFDFVDSKGDLSISFISTLTGDYATTQTTVKMVVTDNDTPSGKILVDPTSVSVTETSTGGTGSYSVKLSAAPTDQSAVVNLTVFGAEGVTVDPGSLTFTTTNWNEAQTVTVTVAADNDSDDAKATITHQTTQASGYGAQPVDVTVNVTDMYSGSTSIDPVFSATSIEATETLAPVTATYTVKLSSAPSANVKVSIAQPANAYVDVDTNTGTEGLQTELTFTPTNWNTAQTVTLTVYPDHDGNDATATLAHTVASLPGATEVVSGSGSVSVAIDDEFECPPVRTR
ncbi:MAG: hypothetical protein F4Y63_07970 [Chloroflexi bacterium]|nr:hypothetical protein [Chloroflexota bacterium]